MEAHIVEQKVSNVGGESELIAVVASDVEIHHYSSGSNAGKRYNPR